MIDWDKLVTLDDIESNDILELKKKVASIRYENEIRGILVMGMLVDTGRDSQGLISGACLAAIINPEYTVNWKTSDNGFQKLTANQIISLATDVRSHVQMCFDREHELVIAIDNGTFVDEMLHEGWPVYE